MSDRRNGPESSGFAGGGGNPSIAGSFRWKTEPGGCTWRDTLLDDWFRGVNRALRAYPRLFACRLPARWDQVAAGFASGMGPPLLPVMGPP